MNRPLRSKKLWGGKMKLESFSKEELISWLRTHSFNGASEDKIISDLLYEKSHKLEQKRDKAQDKFFEVWKEYNELLKPYEGKHLSEIPIMTLHYGAELESKMKRLKDTMDKIQKEYDRNWQEYSKRMGL